MPRNILDEHFSEGKSIKVRYFFCSFLELLIILADALGVLVGVGYSWYYAFQDLSNYWLLLINPVIFILLFGLPSIKYLWAWRVQSIELEKTQNIQLYNLDRSDLIGYAQFVSGVITFLLVLSVFINFRDTGLVALPISVWGIIAYFVVIGPVQFLYVYYINRTDDSLSYSVDKE